jgi:hypothetical protein
VAFHLTIVCLFLSIHRHCKHDQQSIQSMPRKTQRKRAATPAPTASTNAMNDNTESMQRSRAKSGKLLLFFWSVHTRFFRLF